MYLSHFMYHGLVTTLHTLYLLDMYMMMYVSSPLSHMCWFFSLFMPMFLLLYNLSLFHN